MNFTEFSVTSSNTIVKLSRQRKQKSVIFNRGFAVETKSSASICQGFRGWSVKKTKIT